MTGGCLVEKRLRVRNGWCTACTSCTAWHCSSAKLVHLCSVVWGGVSVAGNVEWGLDVCMALLGKTRLWTWGVEQRRKSALHDDESGAALRRVKRQVG